MDTAYMTGVSGMMADFADLLSRLDVANLPALFGLSFTYDSVNNTWNASAQLWGAEDEADKIDAVRTWAGVLGGCLHLSDLHGPTSTYGGFRRLDAVADLEFGVQLRVWDHLMVTSAPALAAA